MSDPRVPSPVRSSRRDGHVRAVSRITRAVAALAVLGTATFWGLAAGGTAASPSTPAAAPDVASAPAAVVGDTGALATPSQAPAASAQAPVASSGGS